MLFLLGNIILILCNLAPDLFPLCQVWLKVSFIKGGRGFDLKALGFINTTEPCFQNRDKSVLGVNF